MRRCQSVRPLHSPPDGLTEAVLKTSVPLFRNYLATYLSHPAAAKYRGKSIVTTFAGESCTFGAGSVNAGWSAVFAGYRDKIWFAPAFNTDPMRLPSFDIDAETNWGSAWPDKGKEIETSRDEWFMKQLGSKGYIGTVSPLFATHLSYKVSVGVEMAFRSA